MVEEKREENEAGVSDASFPTLTLGMRLTPKHRKVSLFEGFVSTASQARGNLLFGGTLIQGDCFIFPRPWSGESSQMAALQKRPLAFTLMALSTLFWIKIPKYVWNKNGIVRPLQWASLFCFKRTRCGQTPSHSIVGHFCLTSI